MSGLHKSVLVMTRLVCLRTLHCGLQGHVREGPICSGGVPLLRRLDAAGDRGIVRAYQCVSCHLARGTHGLASSARAHICNMMQPCRRCLLTQSCHICSWGRSCCTRRACGRRGGEPWLTACDLSAMRWAPESRATTPRHASDRLFAHDDNDKSGLGPQGHLHPNQQRVVPPLRSTEGQVGVCRP